MLILNVNRTISCLLSPANRLYKNPRPILKAASWRILEKYGGHLHIDEFRQNFNEIDYIDMDNYITEYPLCKPIGFIFEKKIKF